jgi:hypothetical protein
LIAHIEKQFMGFSDNVVKLMKDVPGGPAGQQNSPYINDRNLSMHHPLQPGLALKKANAAVLKSVATLVNEFGTDWEEINVRLWLRDSFTKATSRGIYGAAIPITDDPELIQALW